MESYNPALKVGMECMVVNTRQVKNRHLVGSVVTVEALSHEGEAWPLKYMQADFHDSCWKNSEGHTAIVSGVSGLSNVWIENHASFRALDLMPITPTGDFLQELREETNPYKEMA